MNHTISERQLQNLADMFSENNKTETAFKGHRIIVEQFGETFDYEILYQDSYMGQWHTFHTDEDFETEAQALEDAKKYIENWEPNDDYYAQ